MRERRPEDWVTDLARRYPLEDVMARALQRHPDLMLVERQTESFDALDYAAVAHSKHLCRVELKAKHQPYRGWSRLRPDVDEADLFVLDELALRKLVDGGRFTFLVVADLPHRRWLVWSTLDLVLASKVRTLRPLRGNETRDKGKVLLTFREAARETAGPDASAAAIAELASACDAHWGAVEPWPHGSTIVPWRRSS